jgi:tetratricopeptide (TPR) repeat protein
VLEALALSQGRLSVVITLRADFLRQASERTYSGLAQQIEQGMLMVSPLTATEIKDVVIQPALSLDVTVEPALVEAILKDVETAPGFLPLLQYAMTELWRVRRADALTLTDYIRIKRLAGALEKKADSIYLALAEAEQSAAKWLFLSVTQLGEGTQDTRKRAFQQDLISQRHHESLIETTLKKLTDARLLVSNVLTARASDGKSLTVIDIAHEALISHWGRLREWIDSEREFKKWRDGLTSARLEWIKHHHDDGLFLHGAKLLEAQEKLNDYQDMLNTDDLDFIALSDAFHQQELQEKQQAQQRIVQQKELALEVISTFTYKIPQALANIPQTAQLTVEILEYNIQSLEKIYALNPDDKITQWHNANNYERIGDLWINLFGDTEKALENQLKGLEIRQKLAEKYPDAQRNLSVSFNKLGTIHLQLGKTDSALDYYQQSHKMLKQIATQDPQNSAAQRDLSVSFNKLGNIYLQLNQTDTAQDYYQQALKIRQKIATQDLQNSAAQRDLSISFEKLGNIYLQLNQTDTAQDYYQQALKIRQKIAIQDPQNSAAQRDLFVSFYKLATVEKQLKYFPQARDWFQKALKIAEKRAAEDKQNYQAQTDLEDVKKEIKALESR